MALCYSYKMKLKNVTKKVVFPILLILNHFNVGSGTVKHQIDPHSSTLLQSLRIVHCTSKNTWEYTFPNQFRSFPNHFWIHLSPKKITAAFSFEGMHCSCSYPKKDGFLSCFIHYIMHFTKHFHLSFLPKSNRPPPPRPCILHYNTQPCKK